MYIKKYKSGITSGLILLSTVVMAQPEQRIMLNQVGYYTNAPKMAMITGNINQDIFYITSTSLRDTLYSANLGTQMRSAYSSTVTRLADFSPLKIEGSYVVMVPGLPPSYVFRIGDDVFKETAIATLKGFYFQRSSIPLEYRYAGKWHRSAGHPDQHVYIHPSAASAGRPAGMVISSPGGWYDAGDYNKYIVNSGITMGTLFSAYEDFPNHYLNLVTNIPESRDQVPDILNEVIYNLRWMLTMQDPGDGGVYHKCTNAKFDGMVMPGVTKDPRYVVQKSTAAALDFAAVTAQASRILRKFEKHFPGLSDSCLKAAEKAWQWSEKNPKLLYDQTAMNKTFRPEVSTGAYGDRNLEDEWLWAATELYITSHQDKYFLRMKQGLKNRAGLPSWSNVGMLAYYSMIRHQRQLPGFSKNEVAQMKDTIIRMAENFISNARRNAFVTVMGQTAGDYNWGGNANAANQGILLVQAYMITKNKKYIDAALSNMDYILGRNATGYSFITGIGSKTPMHPHHRPSEADGITEPVPGLLVGGPNRGMQDNCTYKFKEVETAYLDGMCSYASNEIAINWNAPIVYLANAIEAIRMELGYVKGE